MTDIFLGEFLGTMVLLVLGNGVVANVVFKKTIGAKSGFLAITIGWGLAVFMGVIVANAFNTGGHLNPAVTMMLWVKGAINASKAFVYMGSEFAGALVGQLLVSIVYWQHIQEKENSTSIISIHSTGPTHNKVTTNLLTEFIATGLLVSVAMVLGLSFQADNGDALSIMKFAGPLSMGLVVLGIGISLGGVTGYAINPFRDLAPRIVYALMPYKNKPPQSANWSYAWIPILGPLAAGIVVGAFGRLM